jgi:hypothetical protein
VTAVLNQAGSGKRRRGGRAGGWWYLRVIARRHAVSIRQAFAIVRLVGRDRVAIALAAARLAKQSP